MDNRISAEYISGDVSEDIRQSVVQPVDHPMPAKVGEVTIVTDQLMGSEHFHDANSNETSARSSSVYITTEVRARAYDEATRTVDQMIANHQISQEQLRRAIALLRDSDQENRRMELGTRILLAIERGELTQQQAGIIISPSTPVE